MAIDEIYEESGQRFRPRATLRMGEIVLIVDSDAIVPEVSYILIVVFTLARVF